MEWLLLFILILEGVRGLPSPIPPPSPTNSSLVKDVIVNVVTRKWMHLLNDKFLSFTLNPHIALEFQDYRPSTMSMFRGLSPAMVRLGGPEIDHVAYLTSGKNTGYTITEEQWTKLNKLARWTNLDLIVCLNPMERIHGVWQSKEALEFIDASDKLGYDLQWELGYELQRLRNLSEPLTGSELGRDVVRLRKILDSFPRYSKSSIIGPDIVSVSDHEEMNFIKEFLNESGDALAVVTWHPEFAKEGKENEDIVHTLTQVQRDAESLLMLKDPNRIIIGKPPLRKDVWISESHTEESTGEFSDALTWAKRLGSAAMLGFPVYMKQITRNSVTQPNHDFWVSMLYKSLVGRAVLEAKLLAGEKDTTHVFAHCTEMSQNNIIDSDFEYERGAVTMYGVNLAPEEIKVNIKGSYKDEPVHIYILTADDRNNPQETYLNGELLKLSPMGQLPVISPKIKNATRNVQVEIPARSVYFIVLPEMKARQCATYPIMVKQTTQEMLEELPNPLVNVDQDMMDITNDGERKYVRFGPKKKVKSQDFEVMNANSVVSAPDDKLLKLKFPIPESENTDNKVLERPVKSITNKNTINQMAYKEEKLMDRNTEQKKEEFIGNEENKIVKWNNSDNEMAEAMANTKFVMFSDDDWLSNFSHARKAVEAAKKIIEAFDEAEQIKKNDSDMQSVGSKVENDRYHIRYGKDGLRKKKFAVVSTSVPEYDTKPDAGEATIISHTSMPNTSSTTATPKQSSGNPTESTILSTNTFTEIKARPEIGEKVQLLQKGRQDWKENDTKPVNANPHLIKSGVIKEKFRRSINNTEMTRNTEADTTRTNASLIKSELISKNGIQNVAISNEDESDVKPTENFDDKSSNNEQSGESQERKFSSPIYHPKEFYEHINFPTTHIKKSSDYEDLYEAEPSDQKGEEGVPESTVNNMPVVQATCKDAETDKTIKDMVQQELQQYYKNTEKLVTESEEDFQDNSDSPVNDQMELTKTNEQKRKRQIEKQLYELPALLTSNNMKNGAAKFEKENEKSTVNSEKKGETQFVLDKSLRQDEIKSSAIPIKDEPVKNTDQIITKQNKIQDIIQVEKDGTAKVNTTELEESVREGSSKFTSNLKKTNIFVNKEDVDKSETIKQESKPLQDLYGNRSVVQKDNSYFPEIEPGSSDAELHKNKIIKSDKSVSTTYKNQPQMTNPDVQENSNAEFNLEIEGISNSNKTRMARNDFNNIEPEKLIEPKLKDQIGSDQLLLNNKMEDEENETLISPFGKEEKVESTPFMQDERTRKLSEIKLPESNSNSWIERVGKEQKQNLDIVCGRTKNFGTFCVGSEHAIDQQESEDFVPTHKHHRGIGRYEKDLILKNKDNVIGRGMSNNVLQRSRNKEDEWYEYLQEGSPTCKASRSAPYIEDFEELMSQIDELRKDPSNSRHRRLVHFTVPASNMDQSNDEEYLHQDDRDNFGKSYENLDMDMRDFYDRQPQLDKNIHHVNMKEENYVPHKSLKSHEDFRADEETLNRDLHSGFDGDGYNDYTEKEQTKRTVVTVPAIKPQRKLRRKDEPFGSEVSYNNMETDSEKAFTSSKIFKNRNPFGEEQYNTNRRTHARHRKPSIRTGLNDFEHGDFGDYYQRIPQSERTFNPSGDDYNDRHFRNEGVNKDWADKSERDYVQLPGDVFSEMEGTRNLRSNEPHFIKSDPIQMMPVALSSPEMFRPKYSKTNQRAKRSTPYFRDVRNDIALMKSALDSSQFAHEKSVVYSAPTNKLQHDVVLKPTHHELEPKNNMIYKKIYFRMKRSQDEKHLERDNNMVPFKIDERRRNEIIQSSEQQPNVDNFDELLIKEKNKQYKLLQKKLSDLAKLYTREKDIINSGLTTIMNDEHKEEETRKNESKPTIPVALNRIIELRSPVTDNEIDSSEIKNNYENKQETFLQDENETNATDKLTPGMSVNNTVVMLATHVKNVLHLILESLMGF